MNPNERTEDNLRRLFIDDYHVSQIHNLKRTMHTVEKNSANPIIRPDRPWEGPGIQIMNGAAYDDREGCFKIWYYADGRIAYAVSRDGKQWVKPELGLKEFQGDRKNNLVDGSAWNIVSGPDDFGSSEPYFRGIGWSHELGQHLEVSDDGFHWENRGTCKVEGAGDTFFSVKATRFNGRDGGSGCPGYLKNPPARYLGVARWCMPVGRFDGSGPLQPTRRVLAMLSSDNMLEWKNPIRILTPDERDDEMAHERIEAALADGSCIHDCKEDRRCEFYIMTLIPYEEMYLGMLLVFDPSYEFNRIGKNNNAGPGETQLVASRDLVNWHRLGDRRPFIPRGPRNEFDWALAWYPAVPLFVDDRLWFYYTGVCTTHAGSRDTDYWNRMLEKVRTGEIPGVSSIGLATLRRDGFVSLDAGSEPGYVLTKAFVWPAKRTLFINADATDGEVRVSICQPDGTPYNHCELSVPIRGDSPAVAVRWPQPKATMSTDDRHTHGTDAEAGVVMGDEHGSLGPGKMARLKFHLSNAKIYSYWFE